MDTEKKRIMEQKKARLRDMLKDAERQMYKEAFAKEIRQFDQKYRYAEEAEAIQIEKFLAKLHFVRPAQLVIEEVCPYMHRNVYLCFLAGSEVLLQIYLFGQYADFLRDYEIWSMFSPYLLLVDEDFIHYTYINDYGERAESRINRTVPGCAE